MTLTKKKAPPATAPVVAPAVTPVAPPNASAQNEDEVVAAIVGAIVRGVHHLNKLHLFDLQQPVLNGAWKVALSGRG